MIVIIIIIIFNIIIIIYSAVPLMFSEVFPKIPKVLET